MSVHGTVTSAGVGAPIWCGSKTTTVSPSGVRRHRVGSVAAAVDDGPPFFPNGHAVAGCGLQTPRPVDIFSEKIVRLHRMRSRRQHQRLVRFAEVRMHRPIGIGGVISSNANHIGGSEGNRVVEVGGVVVIRESRPRERDQLVPTHGRRCYRLIDRGIRNVMHFYHAPVSLGETFLLGGS